VAASTTLTAVLRLIVNADDYGLTPGINRAVEELFVGRALTSATLMTGAPCVGPAVAFARTHIELGVGCHLTLLDGAPVADPASVPSLLSNDGKTLHRSLRAFLSKMFRGGIQADDIEREVAAQIQRMKSLGLTPTHVDTHKHTHMFPEVLAPLLKAAKSLGILAIRNPFEPEWSVRTSPGAGWKRKTEVRLLRRFRGTFLRQVTQQGFTTTEGTLGVAATGSLTSATLRALLESAPTRGTFELVCHPGYVDDELRASSTHLLASRTTEVASLMESASLLRQKAELISYRELST
jgi:chitin disaccharide deacetylase